MAKNYTLPSLISELLQRADAAQPIREINNSGLPRELSHLASDDQVRYINQPAAASLLVPAQSVDLAGLFNAEGTGLARIPRAVNAGSTIRLSTGLAALSQVAQAGAGIIQWDQPDAAVAIPGSAGRDGVAWMRRPKALRVVQPAQFDVLDQDANDTAAAADQEQPVKVAAIDFVGNSKVLAASWTLPRKDRREIDPEQLTGEIAQAIAMGLADSADRLLLAQINAGGPTDFSIAKLAAARLQLSDVAAIAGTAGTGAVIGADGVLRAAGVAARLTDQATGTLVGDFTRAALVIGERFDVHAKKLGRSGDLEITVLVDVLPVVADASTFWNLAA